MNRENTKIQKLGFWSKQVLVFIKSKIFFQKMEKMFTILKNIFMEKTSLLPNKAYYPKSDLYSKLICRVFCDNGIKSSYVIHRKFIIFKGLKILILKTSLFTQYAFDQSPLYVAYF